MTINGTYIGGVRIDDARGAIELQPEVTNRHKPIRLEDLTYSQVTAIIVQLDDLRRDMRHTAAGM